MAEWGLLQTLTCSHRVQVRVSTSGNKTRTCSHRVQYIAVAEAVQTADLIEQMIAEDVLDLAAAQSARQDRPGNNQGASRAPRPSLPRVRSRRPTHAPVPTSLPVRVRSSSRRRRSARTTRS